MPERFFIFNRIPVHIRFPYFYLEEVGLNSILYFYG